MTQPVDLKKLADFFPANAIEWRPGNLNFERTRAQAIPYINARAVQQRLDEVVGPENWKNEFKPSPLSNGVVCAISIRVTDGTWVSKEDGAQYEPEGADSTSPEMAVKGAYSNALKRAAVMWGIGRYLYAVNHAWVEVDDQGNFTKTPTLPSSLLPQGDKSVSQTPRLAVVPAPRPVAVESTKDAANSSPGEDSQAAATTGDAPVPTETATAAPQASPAASTRAPARSTVVKAVEAAPSPAPAPAPSPAPVADAQTPADAATEGAASKLTPEMLDALDQGTRNYVQQLAAYIEEGRNLTTVSTSLTNGRAFVRLNESHPDVLQCLKNMARERMEQKVAA